MSKQQASRSASRVDGFLSSMICPAVIVAIICWACSVSPAAEPSVLMQWTFDQPVDISTWPQPHDIKDMHVADGCLRMTFTGKDAYFVLPPVSLPLDGCVVRVRMRAALNGFTQVYWQTKEDTAFAEKRQTSREQYLALRPESERDHFVTVDLPIGSARDAGRTLTAVRIDPFNGNRSGMVEFDSIQLLRQPPVIMARLATASHWVEVGESTAVRAILRQAAGAAATDDWSVEAVTPRSSKFHRLRPSDQPQPIGDFRSDQPGVHCIRARITPPAPTQRWDIEQAVIVGRESHLPLSEALRGEQARIDLVPMHDNTGIAAARWQIRTADGRWQQAGMLLPLATLTVSRADGQIVRALPRMQLRSLTSSEMILEGVAQIDGDWRCSIAFQLDRHENAEYIRVRANLAGPAGAKLLNFTAPELRVEGRRPTDDIRDRHGLFGGLEFLEPGWNSSSDRAVGRRFADRWMPTGHKITLPMMAVASDGLCSAMLWNPLQADASIFDKQKSGNTPALGPAALFASPNFLDGQANHLMSLAWPPVNAGRDENQDIAHSPYPMQADKPLTIEFVLRADERADVRSVARQWYEVFGAPPPPPVPHDDATTYNLFARHLGETMWDADRKAWLSHWQMKIEPQYHPWVAGELIAHALITGDQQWVEKTHLRGRTLIDAAGTLMAAAKNPYAQRVIASMRPDGTWPYQDHAKARALTTQLSEGEFDTLGEAGTTSLGTCAQPALGILRQAVLTGDDQLIRAGLQALEGMKQFHVPRGAQVWEVHKDIPDIRAAALAIEAYQLGYRLTGDERYLDEANAWAWSGVPFVYAWRVPVQAGKGSLIAAREPEGQAEPMSLSEGFMQPDRQVTPYGTVPVLGPTAYVVNWFGVIVQWCGLEWAWKVIELDKDRPDQLLRYIADGVVRSGQQQIFDRPPWVGLYPDVWFVDEHRACGAFIWGQLPMQCLESQGRLPCMARSWNQALASADGNGRWYVSGWGRPIELSEPGPGPWTATIEFLAGQPNELIMARVAKPRMILLDQQPLEAMEDANTRPSAQGWHYDAGTRLLAARFVQPAAVCKLRIDW